MITTSEKKSYVSARSNTLNRYKMRTLHALHSVTKEKGCSGDLHQPRTTLEADQDRPARTRGVSSARLRSWICRALSEKSLSLLFKFTIASVVAYFRSRKNFVAMQGHDTSEPCVVRPLPGISLTGQAGQIPSSSCSA